MQSERIETGVDSLLKFLKDGKRHFLEDVSKELKVDLEVLKLWVDFLVEEKVIKIEYSFTKPFIFIDTEMNKSKSGELNSLKLFKEEFKAEALKKGIPENQIEQNWKNNLQEYVLKLREFFITEAKKRNIQNIDDLWNEYKQKLMGV